MCIAEFADILGEDKVISDKEALAPYSTSEWSSYSPSKTEVSSVVVCPSTTEEVSRVMEICHRRRLPVTAYAGGTSLEGHFAPTRGGVCIDFQSMDQILKVHKDDLDVVVQPAVQWEVLNEELAKDGLFFPPDPGPGAMIGGMVGTGCSGTNAYHYGTMRDWVLSLTVVLADGTIIKTRQRPRKSSAGYDLTKIFIGSEGTLGLVTEATLKLAVKPMNEAVAVASFPSVHDAASCVSEVVKRGVNIAAVELLDDVQMKCINTSQTTSRSWDEAPTLFFKFSGAPGEVKEKISIVQKLAENANKKTFTFARNSEEVDELWSARKVALWSILQMKQQPTDHVWTTDVAVPMSRLPDIIEQTREEISASGLLGGIVGHVGDGNFHAMLLFNDGQRKVAESVVHNMVKRAVEMEGTVTGEHGVGMVKRDYLEHELGKTTVDTMRRYSVEWLESMRKVFAVIVQKLEAQYLPLTIPDSPTHGDSTSSVAQRYMKSYLAIDDRLEMPPIQTPLLHVWRGYPDYTYTLDLDRELLGVDHSVYFKLSKISRGGRWHQHLDEDDNRRRMVLREDTPENIVGDAALKPSINSEARAKYDTLDVEPIPSEVFCGSFGTLLPREALLLSTFSCMHSSFKKLLDPFILEWTPERFSFREIAFALLSIAAGEVTFESIRALNRNYEAEGYYVLPDGRLLPRFLYERHLPGVEPGSAPQNHTYWFSNVLVHLASRLDIVDVEKAAVIEAVDAGLAQGLDAFYAMVFSLSDVILVHVQKGGGRVRVQRSDLMPLFYFHEESSWYPNGPRTRPTQATQPPTLGTNASHALQCKTQTVDDTSRCSKASDGNDDEKTMIEDKRTDDSITFTVMMRFLDMAARLRLASAKPRRVPNEILTSVMHFTDPQTYKKLTNVSSSCRQLSDHKFRLNDSFDVVGIDAQSMGTCRRFIMEDIHTGEKLYPEIQHDNSDASDFSLSRDAPEDMLELYIVTGEETTRRSIVSLAVLRFLNLPTKDTACTNKVQMHIGLKLFYYIHRREEAPGLPPNASPTSIQFAVSCTDPEPKHRLVQLIPGSEPIDLKHRDGCEKFEQWVQVFCGKEDPETEWDPITGEYITMARRTEY
ncbi:hypothetical protein APSETT445_002624 [Aspergillus pseudonomiae]